MSAVSLEGKYVSVSAELQEEQWCCINVPCGPSSKRNLGWSCELFSTCLYMLKANSLFFLLVFLHIMLHVCVFFTPFSLTLTAMHYFALQHTGLNLNTAYTLFTQCTSVEHIGMNWAYQKQQLSARHSIEQCSPMLVV